METLTDPTSAIIIGGGMAGLLAARALSDHVDRVTVIERDELPDEPAYRPGVPQARHLHGLMVRGQRVLDKLFPGFTGDMARAGAPRVVWGQDGFFFTTGGATRRFNSGLTSNIIARVDLEWLVRRRVAALPNVHFLTGRNVEGLITSADGKSVVGVTTTSRACHAAESLDADLVVDASGRGSKAPEWLKALGYDAPAETVIDAHCGYASRWYEIPDNPAFRHYLIAIQPRPAQQIYRGGGLLRVNDRHWVVTLIGGNQDYPPTDEAAFMEYARNLPSPTIYHAIRDAKPITPIYGYRRLENRLRHYERLSRRPENFIVIGDAACGFNPIYGQGMTTAALEAEMLADLLNGVNVRQLSGFAARFHHRLYALIQNPWMMAVMEDLRYPGVGAGAAGLKTRLGQRYFDWVAQAMPYDNVVTKGFFEAMNMLRPPASLLRPSILWRVLRGRFLRGKMPLQAQNDLAGEWLAAQP